MGILIIDIYSQMTVETITVIGGRSTHPDEYHIMVIHVSQPRWQDPIAVRTIYYRLGQQTNFWWLAGF